MTKDSETLSLDLANDFPQVQESQTRHKERTKKSAKDMRKYWRISGRYECFQDF